MNRKALIIKPAYLDHKVETDILSPLGFEIEAFHPVEEASNFERAIGEAEIIFVRDSIIDAKMIAKMSCAKGIVRYGIGVDTIDLNAAKAKSIIVARVNDYGAEIEVADHTVAMLLSVVRRVTSRDRDVRNGKWQVGQKEPIFRIKGSTFGFLGFGRIANAVVHRMRGFGVTDFIAYDPFLKTAPEGIRLVGLEELSKNSDMISLHAPATEQTKEIINASFLAKMKVNAVLVNTSRGALVDEEALYNTLKNKQIFGAALDVFATEPLTNRRLMELESVVLSDHSAWYSEATVLAIQAGAAEQAKQIVLTGEPEFRVA